jgi:hypothetical protein
MVSSGAGSVREIPLQLYGRSLIAWCHLRSAEREFAVSGIASVVGGLTADRGG